MYVLLKYLCVWFVRIRLALNTCTSLVVRLESLNRQLPQGIGFGVWGGSGPCLRIHDNLGTTLSWGRW